MSQAPQDSQDMEFENSGIRQERIKKYSNGQIESRANFLNGEKDGPQETWGQNGKILVRTNYAGGKMHGFSELWHDNGQYYAKDMYINNRLQGLSKSWYRNGQIASKNNYLNGLFHGIREEWNLYGKPHSKRNYIDGGPHGIHEEWSELLYLQGKDQVPEKEYYVYRLKINKEEYLRYQSNIKSTLNRIIRVQDLSKFTLTFL